MSAICWQSVAQNLTMAPIFHLEDIITHSKEINTKSYSRPQLFLSQSVISIDYLFLLKNKKLKKREKEFVTRAVWPNSIGSPAAEFDPFVCQRLEEEYDNRKRDSL